MLKKDIIYFGQSVVAACDGKCSKAWGLNSRKSVQLSDDEDDIAWLSDNELGVAPDDPGTYEGCDGKPINATSGEDLNRWCVRECERCNIFKVNEEIKLRTFNERLYNKK